MYIINKWKRQIFC